MEQYTYIGMMKILKIHSVFAVLMVVFKAIIAF